MKDFFAKHKIKLVAGAVILAVLAAAFYFGGSGPDSKGWRVTQPEAENAAMQAEAPASVPAPAPVQIQPEEVTAAEETSEEPAQTPAEEVPEVPDDVSEAPDDVSEAVPEEPKEAEEAPAAEPAEPESQPEPQPEETPTERKCTISIRCATVLDHMEDVDEGKRELIPADGWILLPIEVTFTEGESVFDVLSRVLRERMMHLEFSQNPVTGAAYIEGIHNLYEFDCGALSGWLYCVNGWFPNYGSSSYILADGDVIEWQFTCDLGYDIGGGGVTQ